MNCYLCDTVGEVSEAVAICRECGVALCRVHMDQGLLAERPAGLVRVGCVHNPTGIARWRREIQRLEGML